MARTENVAHFLLILSKAMVSAAIVFVQHDRKSKLSAFRRGDQLHFTSEGLHLPDATRINDLNFRLAGEEGGDADVAQSGSRDDIMGAEFVLSHHRIEGLRLLCALPQVPGEAW